MAILGGCNEKAAKTASMDKTPGQTISANEKVIYAANDSAIFDFFQDSAKIAPNEKIMIIVFGTNTDPYSDQLKADVKNNPELGARLKGEFSSYYLRAHKNLNHKFYHDGEFMDVDTKTLLSIYAIDATPSIIFSDEKGKVILMVPGYMPPKQFLQTMNFMKEGIWRDKDRKNGEIYEALRDYYLKHGIDVTKKESKK